MRIGIIGVGHVGGALGKGWAKAGHEVLFGLRDPKDPKHAELLQAAGPNASGASVTEAADAGEVILLATPWNITQGIAQTLGDLGGKPLLDATNPLKPDLSGLDLEPGTSGGELVATWCPGANVVKIFNTTGADNMENPSFPDGAAMMPYCGDDAAAKEVARQLAADLGFAPLDSGDLKASAMLESLALFWISLAYKQGLGRDFAFRLMRR